MSVESKIEQGRRIEQARRKYEQEAMTAYVILLYSKDEFVDYIKDEVGLGGRVVLRRLLSATNKRFRVNTLVLNAEGLALLDKIEHDH